MVLLGRCGAYTDHSGIQNFGDFCSQFLEEEPNVLSYEVSCKESIECIYSKFAVQPKISSDLITTAACAELDMEHTKSFGLTFPSSVILKPLRSALQVSIFSAVCFDGRRTFS